MAVTMMNNHNKKDFIGYRIFYKEKNAVTNDTKFTHKDSLAVSMKSLTKELNRMIKKSDGRINVYSVHAMYGKNKFVPVKFLNEEYAKQRFLTGYKERLLMNLKYNYKYDVKSNF
jgi:hypothetical protein